MLFLDRVTPATQAEMRVTWLSPVEDFVPEGITRKKSVGASDFGQFFSDCAHRCCYKTQPLLLPYLSQGLLCTDSWSPRNFATLPGQQ